jgi:hypothetical protein
MDRFELENQIMNLHSLVDSLNDISYGILESDITQEDVVNAVDGLAVMVELKIARLFDAYKAVFYLDEYCDCEKEVDF